MNNKKILVDIDDTIENLCQAWCEWLNDHYNSDVNPDDITEWRIYKFFDNIPKAEVYKPLYEEDFWKTVTPKLDAIKYLSMLNDEGYDIYLCTNTNYRNVKIKYELIVQKYFPYISWDKVIVCSKKQMIKADILIDDGVHNLIGGDYLKVLLTTPHNKYFDAEKNDVFRVNNWEEIYQVIHLLT